MKLKYNQVLNIKKNELPQITNDEVTKRYERAKARICYTNPENQTEIQKSYLQDLEEAFTLLKTPEKRQKYYKIISIQEHQLLGIDSKRLLEMSDAEVEEIYQKALHFYEQKEETGVSSKEDKALLKHCREVLLPDAFARLSTEEKRTEYLGGFHKEQIEEVKKAPVHQLRMQTKREKGDPIWEEHDVIGREIKLFLLGRLDYKELNLENYINQYLLERNRLNFQGKKVETESLKFFTSEIIVSKLEEPQYRQLIEQMLSKENIEKMKKRAEAVQGEATKEGIYLGSIEGKELVFAKEQFAAVMKANLGKELEKEKQTKQKGEV